MWVEGGPAPTAVQVPQPATAPEFIQSGRMVSGGNSATWLSGCQTALASDMRCRLHVNAVVGLDVLASSRPETKQQLQQR